MTTFVSNLFYSHYCAMTLSFEKDTSQKEKECLLPENKKSSLCNWIVTRSNGIKRVTHCAWTELKMGSESVTEVIQLSAWVSLILVKDQVTDQVSFFYWFNRTGWRRVTSSSFAWSREKRKRLLAGKLNVAMFVDPAEVERECHKDYTYSSISK